MLNIILCVKNKHTESFYKPFVDDHPEEAVTENYRRFLIINPDKVGQYKYCQLYKLGEFEDDDGTIIPCNKMLFDFDDMISKIDYVLKGDEINGK